MKKKKTSWGLIKRVFAFFKIDKMKLIIIFICFLIMTLTNFIQPLILKHITDDGLVDHNMNLIIGAVMLLLLLILIQRLTDVYMASKFADIHNQAQFNTYKIAFRKLLRLKYDYFVEKNSTEIIDMLTMDIGAITSLTERNNVMLISYVFQIFSGLIGLILISPTLTLIVLCMIPVKYFSVTKISDKSRREMGNYLKEMNVFASWLCENISGIKEIKLWNAYNDKEKECEIEQKILLKKKKMFTMMDAWNLFIEFMLEWAVNGALYIIGGLLLIKGDLSLGGLFAFISYSGFVTAPLAALCNMKLLFAQIEPSAKRFFDFLELEDEDYGEESLSDSGSIVFEDVSFSYDGKRAILDHVSFEIPKNAKVAIIGANGSGKTTVLNLLLRFLKPTYGDIKLNDKDISCLKIEEYRNLFSVVSQKPYVFNKSFRDNIDLGQAYEPDFLVDIYKKSGVSSFLTRLTNGENTIIGNDGAKLSGGERQKLAVARALARNTPYIILDEANSGMDVDSDEYLNNIITKEMNEKTVIVVTHKFDYLDSMDIVYKMSNGKVERIK